MFQIQSLQTLTIWTIIVVILLVWFGSRRQPLASVSSLLREIRASRKLLIAFIALLLILVANKYELHLELWINPSWDFTSAIHQLEGNFVYNLQQMFENPVLTDILGFFYLVVFQSLIVASLAIYASAKQTKMIIAVCYAVTLNYLIAIPFYLFVPVNEVWSYAPSGVQFLMLNVFPTFEEQYRHLSGLDNCFPSLHTSISITIALLAIRSGNRRWKWFTCISALTIVFSIFYLGIHWLSDMVAGSALALFASWAGMKLAGVEKTNKPQVQDRSKSFHNSTSHQAVVESSKPISDKM